MAYKSYLTGYTPFDPFEDEEERRRREAERRSGMGIDLSQNQQPIKQTITTDPVTGEQKMKIEGSPYDLSPANPRTPTVVAGPVAPNEQMYRAIGQVESGNRDFYANGQPVVSSSGAMYGMQVLPSTARQPGFGVKPAQSETPEEFNRVGREYYDALLKKYNGNQQLALMAYNQGPGAVDRAIAAGQQPPGQGYAQRVGQAFTNLFPAAQAAPMPQPPVAAPIAPAPQAGEVPTPSPDLARIAQMPGAKPAAQPGPSPIMAPPSAVAPVPGQARAAPVPGQAPAAPAATPGGQGLRLGGVSLGSITGEAPAITPEVTIDAQQRFQDLQDDPKALMDLSQDMNIPEYLRRRSANRAYELLQQERETERAKAKATEMITKGDPRIANELRQSSDEGSWLKMILLGFVSPELAGLEAQKLGFGSTWQRGTLDGQPVEVKVRGDGKVMEGNFADGTPLNKSQLTKAMTFGKNAETLGTIYQYTTPSGEVHGLEIIREKGRVNRYRDMVTGDVTDRAPPGMTHAGALDPAHVKGMTQKTAVETKMRKANQDAAQVQATPPYTEEQIQAAGNDAYRSLTGKNFAGYTPPEGGVAAPGAATRPGASRAEKIANYELPPPSNLSSSPASQALMNDVLRVNPDYDASKWDTAKATRKAYTTGVEGRKVTSLNVAIDHLDTLDKAGQALNNGNLPLFNEIAQRYAKNTGNPAPTNFDALRSIVGSEVAKAVAGGNTALGDREEIRAEISRANSPAQLAGVIRKYQELMAGQMVGLRKNYESAGLKDFDAKLTPRTKEVLGGITAEHSRSNW